MCVVEGRLVRPGMGGGCVCVFFFGGGGQKATRSEEHASR